MSIKEELNKLIKDIETKQFRDGEAKGLISAIQEEQTKALSPVFERLAEDMVGSMAANFEKAIKAIKVEVPEPKATPVDVRLPEMKFADFPAWPEFPEVKIPEIKIPEIHVPTPTVNMPESMKVFGKMELEGVDKKHPLPVILMDADGKPFSINIPMAGGAGGGRGDFFTILGIQNTIGVVTINPDGTPTYATASGSSGGSTQAIDSSGNVYNQANPMPVVVVSGAAATTGSALVDSGGVQYSGSNPVPVTIVSGAGSSTVAQIGNSDGGYSVANPLPITGPVVVTSITNTVAAANVDSSGVQYSGSNPMPITIISGSISSTRAQIGNTDGDFSAANPLNVANGTPLNLKTTMYGYDGGNAQVVYTDSSGRLRIDSINATVAAMNVDSSGVGYSGSNPLPVTIVSGAGSSTVAQIGNSDGGYSVANPLPITGPVVVTSVTNTIAALNVDSSGVGYSGSNPLPVTIVAGAGTSTKAQIGNSDGDYSASNPLPTTIVSGVLGTTASVLTRQTNPTAVAADYVPIAADDLGRQLTRPIQVRDLIKTAYVTLSTGSETTLLAAVAGAFLDLIYIIAANTSSAAQQVDIRATTGGNIVSSLYIPANSSVGFALPVPFPQDNQGNNWTVDMADVTNSNILISALFSQEV